MAGQRHRPFVTKVLAADRDRADTACHRCDAARTVFKDTGSKRQIGPTIGEKNKKAIRPKLGGGQSPSYRGGHDHRRGLWTRPAAQERDGCDHCRRLSLTELAAQGYLDVPLIWLLWVCGGCGSRLYRVIVSGHSYRA